MLLGAQTGSLPTQQVEPDPLEHADLFRHNNTRNWSASMSPDADATVFLASHQSAVAGACHLLTRLQRSIR